MKDFTLMFMITLVHHHHWFVAYRQLTLCTPHNGMLRNKIPWLCVKVLFSVGIQQSDLDARKLESGSTARTGLTETAGT